MEFLTPQVQLFHYIGMDAPNEYLVHAITIAQQTNLRANGHFVHSTQPDADNTVHIDLFVQELPGLPLLAAETPLVHTINVGPVAFNNGQGFFHTRIILQPPLEFPGGGRSLDEGEQGSSTTSTTSSKKVDRPIEQL